MVANCIWATVLSLPEVFQHIWDPCCNNTAIYYGSIFVIGFAVPVLAMAINYCRIRQYIRKRTKQFPISRLKLHSFSMLFSITTCQILFLLPLFVFKLLHRRHISQQWCLAASAAIKPAIYTLLNSNFRRGCKEVLQFVLPKGRKALYTVTTRPSISRNVIMPMQACHLQQ